MLGKLKETYEAARLKLGVWRRERKERAAERKAEAALPEYGFDRTPRRIRFAVLLATWAVIGFLLLWITQITGVLQLDLAIDWALDRPFALDWDLRLDLNVLPLIVLGIVSFAIVFWSKSWVSLFAATPWNEWFSKWGALVLGVGGSLAIIMGGFEVNQNTREEDFRGALVAEQTATQGRAAIQAQIDSIDQRLAAMRDQSRVGVYAAIAASVGAAAYDSDYLSDEAMARTAADRRDIVRRARGAAVAADTLERDRLALVGQLAEATPVAATQAVVEMTDPVSRFIGGVGAWRIVILVLVGDLILLLGNYFADKAEERARGYMVPPDRSGWAGPERQVEDKHDQPSPIYQSAQQAAYEVLASGGTREDAAEAARAATRLAKNEQKRRVFNAETGREEVWVQPKGHWRPTGKKVNTPEGAAERMEFQPEAQDDETGVAHDGGNRIGSSPDSQEREEAQPEQEQDHIVLGRQEVPPSARDGDEPPMTAPVAETEIAHPEPFALDDADYDSLPEEETLAAAKEGAESAENHESEEHQPAEEGHEHERLGDEGGDNGAEIAHDEPQDEPEERKPETRQERLLAAAK